MWIDYSFLLKGEAYRNFINSLDSEVTKSHYRHVFPYFMNFCNIDNYEEMLKFDQQKLEGIIRDYIIHLRQDKKLAPSSILILPGCHTSLLRNE